MTTRAMRDFAKRLADQASSPDDGTIRVALTRVQRDNVARYNALARRPKPAPLPMVTREEFAGIACTRCGNCCTMLTMSFSPPDRLQHFADTAGACLHGRTRRESMRQVRMIAEMLVKVDLGPVAEHVMKPGHAVYSCRHFKRGADGLGICTVYDRRPDMCAGFPYGKEQAIPDCSYYVHQVIRKLPMIPSPIYQPPIQDEGEVTA